MRIADVLIMLGPMFVIGYLCGEARAYRGLMPLLERITVLLERQEAESKDTGGEK